MTQYKKLEQRKENAMKRYMIVFSKMQPTDFSEIEKETRKILEAYDAHDIKIADNIPRAYFNVEKTIPKNEWLKLADKLIIGMTIKHKDGIDGEAYSELVVKKPNNVSTHEFVELTEDEKYQLSLRLYGFKAFKQNGVPVQTREEVVIDHERERIQQLRVDEQRRLEESHQIMRERAFYAQQLADEEDKMRIAQEEAYMQEQFYQEQLQAQQAAEQEELAAQQHQAELEVLGLLVLSNF